MGFYNVTYDLKHKPESSYQNLWDTLNSYDSVKYQESAYYISTSLTQAKLFDALEKHVKETDKLSVTQFTAKPSWNKAFTGTNAWVNKHFPSK